MYIEAEIRSFVTAEQYAVLLEFFRENAEFVREDEQETHYLDCDMDLRLQKSREFSKVWLKKGKIHDDAREEIEVKFPSDEFGKLCKIFSGIGLGTEIKWFRERKVFDWEGVKVCLDWTKGYGHIIEFEKKCSDSEKDEVLGMLKGKMKKLGVNLSPRKEFDDKYEWYKKNWRTILN